MRLGRPSSAVPWRWVGASIALVLLGAGLVLAGVAVAGSTSPHSAVARLPGLGAVLERSTSQLIGGNLPINEGARDRLDIEANNSPSIAANPADARDLAVTNRIDTPRFSCALHHSEDGGVTWSPTPLPIPPGEEPKCYAPDVTYDSAGVLEVSYVTLKGLANVPNAVWAVRSRDNGRELSDPIRVAGPRAFQARIAADPLKAGEVYIAWLQVDEVGTLRFTHPGNPIMVARSNDGGQTWSAPNRASSPERQWALAPTPATGPRGELYVLYVDVTGDALDYLGGHEGLGGPAYGGHWSLVLARSSDHGATFTETAVDPSLSPIDRFVVFLPTFPALAVDRSSGRLYAAFHDGRDGDADVYVWTSGDGGATFDPPKRVNDTPPHDGTWQYLPALSVSPDGRLDVLYYDRRADRANRESEVSLQSSRDHAATFTPRLRLSDGAFDSQIGFGSIRRLPDLGSRLAVLSSDDRAVAVWSDTRSGTVASGKQDLAEELVSFSTEPRGDGLLRIMGIVLLSLGVVIPVGLTLWQRLSRNGALPGG